MEKCQLHSSFNYNYKTHYCTHNTNMNSRVLTTAVLIATAAFFTSCLEEDVLGPDSPLTHQTLIAEMTGPAEAQQTKTCVDVRNPNTGFIGFLWQPEDEIGVYSQDGNSRNANFKCTAEQNVPQAEFDGEMNGAPYYAYYPYSSDNDNCEVTALKGVLSSEQAFDPESGSLSCDYKYGIRTSDDENTFNFKQLFTMLRITLNASETGLEGERLNNISLSVTDASGKARPICGDFTFSAVDGSWAAGSNTSGSISMPWATRPTLTSGKTYLGFITLMPVVKVGDKLHIEVNSEGHKASFTADCKVEFKAGYVYDLPLTLKEISENNKFGYTEETIERPSIETFVLEVSKNSDKLLNNKLVWNSSSHTPSFTNVSSYTATVNNDTDEITLTIPYLYDFKLKPTFTITGSGVVVKANGQEQENGVTEVDFTHPVTYSLVNDKGASRDYIVKITNTGLPVVIVKHSTSGSYSKEYEGGVEIFGNNIGGTLVNEYVDFMIRGKKADWVKDDHITIYNADGTLDCEVDGGVRLRGNTSKVYPKKPFALKFNEKKSVLGMPKHKRWVLLANWLDHSMIRNAVAFDIAQTIEHAWRDSGGAIGDGIPWNVHGQNVELIVIDKDGDAHHVGNYLLCEQIKIDSNRLDIQDAYDVEEPGADDFTQYGHLLEVDGNYDEASKFKTSKSVPFMFKDEVTNNILNSVKEKVQRIETNIYNGNFEDAYEDLDINSVVDQWLIWELAMNREYGDPRSVYMFMDGDGKLCAGPVWDFDRGTFQNQDNATSLGNSISYRVKPDNEWICWRTQESETYSYIWYKQLIKDPIFQETVQKRWAVIKPYLDMIVGQIEYYGQTQAVSYTFDSAMWPTNTSDIKKYKSDFKDWSGDELLGANGNYQEVINNFITVYKERLAGMDALITSGTFTK